MKKTLSKILNIAVDILVVAILIVSVLVLTIVLTAQGEGGVPSVLGKAPISVVTNSMHGDAPDSFNEGDLLLCDIVDHSVKNDFEVGDIVTFKQDINGDGVEEYVTHRIYKEKDGVYYTKGDNNPTYDQDPNGNVVFKTFIDIDFVARYTGTKIAGFGYVMSYLQTPTGFFLCVLLPMILFFLYQAVRVVINLIAYNKEKALIQAQEAISSSGLTEEQKAKAIAEYLAAQQASSPETENGLEEGKSEEEKTEEKSDEDEKVEENESSEKSEETE
ncbi:MAG: signal peptidase I [Ruminococcus sp.]|nr:signal peptidase I [Ruminococcus sp.]